MLARALFICSIVAVTALGCTPSMSWNGASGANPEAAPQRIAKPELKIKKLYDLPHRTAKHSTPDAIVVFMSDLDRNEPVHLILYNHGLTNNLNEAIEDWNLMGTFKQAPKNTVIILPEWAQNPEAYSAAAGLFHQKGFFRAMLNEALQRTPELSGMKADNFKDISIMSYSGGFRASRSQILNNGLEEKISAVILLDSLYEDNYFDEWLKKNIHDIAAGRKIYHNYYFDTAGNSMVQLARIRKMLADARISDAKLLHDPGNPKKVMAADQSSQYGILFKKTTLYTDKYDAHANVVTLYFPVGLQTLALREQPRMVASREPMFAI